jgi:hypothetical protein
MPPDILQHATPATQLLEKRQELREVEEALSAQKEVRSIDAHCTLTSAFHTSYTPHHTFPLWQDFKLRMDSLEQRRAELERKEFQLQESLLKFDRCGLRRRPGSHCFDGTPVS